MSETFSHDVFLSHSARDKAAVRDLARRLKDDGLRVWFDEWEIKPGDLIGLKIKHGLEHSRIVMQDLIEQKFASEKIRREVRELEEIARSNIDSQSRELILLGHSMAIAAEAGQTFRELDANAHGYDGEIEFKDANGNPSGRRVHLLFRPGRAYTHTRMNDGREVFVVRDRTLAEWWGAQRDPVMLVARTHEGQIRWMNLAEYFGVVMPGTTYVDFSGQPFTALSVARLRDRLLEESALPTA